MLAVLDPDVIIAGTLARAGACHDILDVWQSGGFEMVMCPRLLWEIEKALRHPRISGKYLVNPDDVSAWVRRLASDSSLHPNPVDPPSRVPGDAKDDYLIQLAVESRAAMLVYRDQHLGKADVPMGLELLYPGEFLKRLTA